VLREEGGVFFVDKDATDAKAARIRERFNRLKKG